MNAILMTAPGGVEVLKLATLPQPELSKPNQLLIRVHASDHDQR